MEQKNRLILFDCKFKSSRWWRNAFGIASNIDHFAAYCECIGVEKGYQYGTLYGAIGAMENGQHIVSRR